MRSRCSAGRKNDRRSIFSLSPLAGRGSGWGGSATRHFYVWLLRSPLPAHPSPLPASGERGQRSNSSPIKSENEYAELHCLSNFSFQRGASSADELFTRAKKLGYRALAITDECSLAGIVRALEASKETGIALIVGTEIRLADGPKLVVLAVDHGGYSDICRLITTGRRRSAKGDYHLSRADAEQFGTSVCVLWLPEPSCRPGTGRTEDPGTENIAKWIMQHFAGRAWLAVELHRGPDDVPHSAQLRELGAAPWPAAGRCRRRAHARAPAARIAGRDDRDPSRLHGCRGRSCAVSERRTPSAPTRPARRDLPRRTARRNAAHRRTLHVRPRRPQLPLPEGTGAGGIRRRCECVSAPADFRRRREDLAAGNPGKSPRRRSTRNSR